MGKQSMNGKVCLVTGSNSGTGYAAALELAKAGATVVMLCRNQEKGKTAQKEIIKSSGNKTVDLLIADLSNLDQVDNAVKDFNTQYNRLDVLLNNAGGILEERRVTPQGLEESFAANYLGPFLLTQLLLDILIKSAPSRIIDVSSIANMYGKINFDDLQTTQKYTYRKAYSQAKLAQLMASYELADHLKDTGVTVNAMHPGAVASGFQQKFSGAQRVVSNIVFKIVGSPPEKAAGTMVYLATSPDVEKVTGKFYWNYKETWSSKDSRNAALRKRMWKETERILSELGYPLGKEC